MQRKLSEQEINERLAAKGLRLQPGEVYESALSKVTFECLRNPGHTFTARASNVFYGAQSCRECAVIEKRRGAHKPSLVSLDARLVSIEKTLKDHVTEDFVFLKYSLIRIEKMLTAIHDDMEERKDFEEKRRKADW